MVYTERGENKRIITVRQRIKQRGGVTMGIIKSTVRVGQKIPKEVLKVARAAARKPINDSRCPGRVGKL